MNSGDIITLCYPVLWFVLVCRVSAARPKVDGCSLEVNGNIGRLELAKDRGR